MIEDVAKRPAPETDEAIHAAHHAAHQRRRQPRWKRWLQSRFGPRTGALTRHSMLPLLIKVFAGFSQVDNEIEEWEIDSALGFLRYDFPEAVYSELRDLYRRALRESQDLDAISKNLDSRLSLEDKILLGVQLYALISRAKLRKDHLTAFYGFMTNLGIAEEAIDIVYQLNTSELESIAGPPVQGQHLETLLLGRAEHCDVVLPGLDDGHLVIGFRFRDLILLKNIGHTPVIMRGRAIRQNEFVRLFEEQQILLGEQVLDYRDMLFYFNAKRHGVVIRLYLSFNQRGEPFVEKAKSKQSFLEVAFGLGVTVTALQKTAARIKGQRLNEGVTVESSLRDRIDFDDRTETPLIDLWRRAKALGERFDLSPARTEDPISNNPDLIGDDDILLSSATGGELLLRIECNHEQRRGELEVLRSDRAIFIDDFPVRSRVALRDGDAVTIGDGQFLRCQFSEGIIEEERNVVNRLAVQDLNQRYGKVPALDSVSFSVERGEMVCVMGPSGCGKSTLLRTLAGQLSPYRGHILLNGVDLYGSPRNRGRLTPYISFIPHEEAIEPLLTVEENLDLAAAIRAPHFSDTERKRRADAKLVELGLSEVRHRRAGGEGTSRSLSGGQRKRLNAGLDMIGISDVYLFDEPTSGLSSKDSEHVLDLIRGLAHNKIVLVSIHQPSARLFHKFHKALLLDHGGKVAFFGTPHQMLSYFRRVREEEEMSVTPVNWGEEDPGAAQPDMIFDVLETPLRDQHGDVIFEEDGRGQLMAARRFSPRFWQDRFQTHRLLEEVHLDEPESEPRPAQPPPHPVRTAKDDLVQFGALMKRAFLSKMRNRSNLTTTLLEAPALALLVSFVLRYSEDPPYNFASAFHLPTYFFLSLVIGMFLGLTNSADEILRDRVLLQRERNHRIRIGQYIFAKITTLGVFALIQCIIFTVIGSLVLGVRGMFWLDLTWMFLTTLHGVVAGLVISSLVPNLKTALNCIPLVLIPQIILGGALIKYEEMNRDLKVEDAFRRLLVPGKESEDPPRSSNLEVPAICAIMPLRWSYEGLIVSHARYNPVSLLQFHFDQAARELARDPHLSPEDEARFEKIKQARPYLHGLLGRSPREVREGLRHLRETLRSGKFDPTFLNDLAPEEGEAPTGLHSKELYLNRKIQDLFMRAEMERTDYRASKPRNVFFGAERIYHVPSSWAGASSPSGEPAPTSIRLPTILVDMFMIIGFSVAGSILLAISIRHKLRMA